MCEIFPEFHNCCMIFSLRIGLLIISILSIITGAISLSAIEQQTESNYENLKNITSIRATLYSFVYNMNEPGRPGCYHCLTENCKVAACCCVSYDPEKAISQLGSLINSGLTFMSVCFMIMGVILLYSVLGDSEGVVQIFVWVIFVNVIFGFFLVIAICFECIFKENKCILKDMDWLSGSALLVIVVIYLFVWIYFISVANSYATGV